MPAYRYPKGMFDYGFPDDSMIGKKTSSKDQKETKKSPSVWEKKDKNVKEVLDLLVNGNPISQLLLDKHIELTERAKEELTILREQATSKLVDENNKQVDELKKEIADLNSEASDLSKRNSELKALNETLNEEKELLRADIEVLRKRKALLIESINDMFSQVLSTDVETLKNIKDKLLESKKIDSTPEEIKHHEECIDLKKSKLICEESSSSDETLSEEDATKAKLRKNSEILMLLDADIVENDTDHTSSFVPFFTGDIDHGKILGKINDWLAASPVNEERKRNEWLDDYFASSSKK